MSSDWHEKKWGDLLTLEYGKSLKGYKEGDGEYQVFGTNGPIGWTDKYLTEGPSIIIGRKGAYRGVEYSEKPFFVIDTAFYVDPKEDFDMLWAYYQMLTIDIDGMDSGSAIPSTSRDEFYQLPVQVPPLGVQKEIANQLKTIDKKIHLNQQTNETLEAMAQAIFKSWFVDFDPVRAKIKARSAGRDPNRAAMAAIAGVSMKQPSSAEASEGRDWDEIEATLDQKLSNMTEEQRQQLKRTAQLFPDELVDSEIGEVPIGWEVVELKKVIKNYDRKRVPLSRREREERPGDYPYYGATSIMDYVDDYLFDGRNVLMAEDGSVMDDEGKPVLQYVDGKIWVNNHAHVLNGKGPISNEILYLFLQTVNVSPYVTGAVQKKINQGNMNSIPFLLCDEKLYDFLSPILKGFFDKIIQNEKENEELEKLRDTLLPKLISGEVEV